jgi:methylthioribose-1-phosphate isomerase
MVPKEAKVYNPAFDIADNELVDAIITEHGVLRQPYPDALKTLLGPRK